MRYKAGDKVRVRQWDDMAKEFGLTLRGGGGIDIPDCTFVKNMKKFCGTVVTVSDIVFLNSRYLIEEDNEHWYWTDDMFENVYYKCAYDKVFESILPKPILFPPKYPKHNDMLDAFTKIPKGEIKITAEETREMMKENTTAETKKVVHPKDEDHLKRVEKIQKKIDYYSNVSGFDMIEKVVPNEVVKVKFYGREYKMIRDPRDTFSMENVLYLTIAKYLYGNRYTSEGIEKKSEDIKYEKAYVKKVEQAMKMLAAMEELKKENEEYEALIESRREKRWKRKQRQMDRRSEKKRIQEEKEREEKIQIQTEAYLRAMKAAKEEGLVTE